MTRPGLAVLRPVPVLGEGAPWIGTLAADYCGERTAVGDGAHAAAHRWSVAPTRAGAESAEAGARAQARIAEGGAHGAPPVGVALAQAVATTTTTAAAVLGVERGEGARTAAGMEYATIADRGWPSGSGAVASRAQHVVQQRMRRPGRRWSCRGAAAMRARRARAASGRPLTVGASSGAVPQ